MVNDYNLNSFIKLLYNEINLFGKLEAEDAIENDEHLSEEYNMLRRMYLALPKVTFYPKQKSVENILHYSRTNSLNASC